MKKKEFTKIPLNELNYHNFGKHVGQRYNGGDKKIFDYIDYLKEEGKYGMNYFVLLRNDIPLNLVFELAYATGMDFCASLYKK